jgi:predicted small secreted protein
MKTTIKLLIITLAASFLLSGCIAVDGYFKNVRNKVFKSVEGDFHKEVEFSLGAAAITLSTVAVSLSDAPDFTDDMLRKIDRVQIGVYENLDWQRYKPNFNSLRAITSDLKEDGYEFIVRTINRDEMVAVMVKGNDYKIKEMFVVAVNDEELVMAQIFGDLDELIEIAIREEGFKVEVAHN